MMPTDSPLSSARSGLVERRERALLIKDVARLGDLVEKVLGEHLL